MERSCLFLLLLLGSLVPHGAAITFMLNPAKGSGKRCVSEHIPKGTLLTGDWELAEEELANASSLVEITGPDERAPSLFRKQNLAEGHFAVTAAYDGVHNICVSSEGHDEPRSVSINLKTALEVSDHDTVAKKEHVEAIEAELDRMKKMAVHVYE